MEEKGVNKYADIKETKQFARDYLQERLDNGLSIWTVKMERSALGKIYGEQIEIDVPKREQECVTRSREEREHDKHFSVTRNADLITIATACGTRREDLGKLRIDSFKTMNGRLYVEILGSKGGRDRIAPVLKEKEQEVKDILERMKSNGKGREDTLFDSVHSKMDVHSYRRVYAKSLYVEMTADRKQRDEVLKQYPKRHETKTYCADGVKEVKEIKSQYFCPRGTKERFERDDLYVVSCALGHNRIDVTYHSYLK